jgi:diadenosine tetraphosphate (Ap4A) HIT family hydrolase
MNYLSSILKAVFHTKARVPAVSSRMSSNCVFCKIVTKVTPSNILHEVCSHRLEILATHLTPFLQDEQFLVFPDISPAAEHHLLVIPKVTEETYL